MPVSFRGGMIIFSEGGVASISNRGGGGMASIGQFLRRSGQF